MSAVGTRAGDAPVPVPPRLRGLAAAWERLPAPSLEWSLGVAAGCCARRPKWVAWTGPGPPDPRALCRAAGLAHLLPPGVEGVRLRNLGLGVEGDRPVCVYLDHGRDDGRGWRIARVGSHETVTYTFHRLPVEPGAPPVLAGLPDAGRRLAVRLLGDPVLRTRSGFWRRSDDARVYLTFPHHPPVAHVRALLGDALDTSALAAHDRQHLRHVCVHAGGAQPRLTVYLTGRSDAFPSGPEDLRRRVAAWGRAVHGSAEAQALVRRAAAGTAA